MKNNKHLKTIVCGVISKLITLNDSFINANRLFNAVDLHVKNHANSPLKKPITQADIDNVLLSLFMSRRILPDVANGNGYIIALNSEEAIASANELYERTVCVTSPGMVCLPVALYSFEDAAEDLKELNPKIKQAVDDVFHNYLENYLDSKDIFPEFSK